VDSDVLHLELTQLRAGLDEIRRAPATEGTVALIVRRPVKDEREVLAEAELDTERGVVGDDWLTRDGDPRTQITLMNARAIAVIAQSEERWPLAGDQLYVDLDLSDANVPPGTRIAIGTAVVEASEVPHRGCKKFGARFGLDALRFVNSKLGYELNLRGINARIVQSGVVRPGDAVRKL
jgi:MOSC domain-containing protein YiiM